MANELVVIERQLQHVEPQLHRALGGLMPAPRLIQTVLTSCERVPRLLACTPQSIMNGAMTFATLGLPVDGATGQGFLLPFGKTAQAVIGYKGYSTLGARAGLTITGAAVREDDHVWDYQLGDRAFVKHKPRLGSKARVIAFWACAASNDRPPIISILSIDEVMGIKARSPAVKAGADTPWNDQVIGFNAMGEKSAKRRLARSTPLITDAPQFMLGARMEEAHDEQGKAAWITPDRGVVVEGEFSSIAAREINATPPPEYLIGTPQQAHDPAHPSLRAADTAPGSGSQADPGAFSSDPSHDAAGSAPAGRQTGEPAGAGDIPSAEEYERRWDAILDSEATSTQIGQTWASQKEQRKLIDWPDGVLDRIMAKVTRAINEKRAQEQRR